MASSETYSVSETLPVPRQGPNVWMEDDTERSSFNLFFILEFAYTE